MSSRNLIGMPSSLESVAIRTGPRPNRDPNANIAFNPYCVRFEIVRMTALVPGYCKAGRPRFANLACGRALVYTPVLWVYHMPIVQNLYPDCFQSGTSRHQAQKIIVY